MWPTAPGISMQQLGSAYTAAQPKQPQQNFPPAPGVSMQQLGQAYNKAQTLPQQSTQKASGQSSGGGGGGGSNFPSNPSVNQFSNGYRWTGNNWEPPAGQGGGSGIDQGVLDQINQIYQGQSNYLNNLLTNVLPQSRDENLKSAGDYYNTQTGLLPGQQSQLLAPIGQNEQAFQGQQESAAAAAQRAYQGLQQQSQAGYGAGSSTGGALNDLAAQQFAINQGQLQQQSGAGQLEFSSEKNQVGQFIAQKHADLDNWLNSAKLQINQNFQAQIAQVNQQQALTEDAKAQAKLGILQSTVEQNRAIQLADQQFRNQLQLFQATQGQQAGSQSLDTSGFSRNLLNLMSQTPQTQQYNVNNLSQGAQAPQLSGGVGRFTDQFTLPA